MISNPLGTPSSPSPPTVPGDQPTTKPLLSTQLLNTDITQIEISYLPKLKKVLISAPEEELWLRLKQRFALDKNIWKNLSLMEEAREDFRQVDEFKELESILLKKLEEDTATNNQLTESLKSVLDRFEELNSADTESTSEIVSLKD